MVGKLKARNDHFSYCLFLIFNIVISGCVFIVKLLKIVIKSNSSSYKLYLSLHVTIKPLQITQINTSSKRAKSPTKTRTSEVLDKSYTHTIILTDEDQALTKLGPRGQSVPHKSFKFVSTCVHALVNFLQ